MTILELTCWIRGTNMTTLERQVARMANALIIADFLRRVVGFKKTRQVSERQKEIDREREGENPPGQRENERKRNREREREPARSKRESVYVRAWVGVRDSLAGLLLSNAHSKLQTPNPTPPTPNPSSTNSNSVWLRGATTIT